MSKSCRKCCKEFKGWCKSFTPTETLLSILEAILLVLLIIFLVFLILHLISCEGTTSTDSTNKTHPEIEEIEETTLLPTDITKTSEDHTITDPTSSKDHTITDPTSSKDHTITTPTSSKDHTITDSTSSKDHTKTTNTRTYPSSVSKSTKCTAVYPNEEGKATTKSTRCTANYSTSDEVYRELEENEEVETETDVSEGVLATDEDKNVVLALVKIKPSGITFGCILTVLSDHWTVTAASCLDAIEEVDSLDAFVMLDDYGAVEKGRSHPVTDAKVHPLYEGGNKSYDVAMLRTEDSLGRRPVLLPSMVDYFRITIGEKFDILGFGKFRSIDNSALGKRVRSVPVYALPSRHCAPAGLEARHLRPLAPVAHARCGAAPLCAGVLRGRDVSCNYCAGAPLLRKRGQERLLLGVMSDNEACGSACEPARYANAARLAGWLRAVTDNK